MDHRFKRISRILIYQDLGKHAIYGVLAQVLIKLTLVIIGILTGFAFITIVFRDRLGWLTVVIAIPVSRDF
jgi:hypothetical protein